MNKQKRDSYWRRSILAPLLAYIYVFLNLYNNFSGCYITMLLQHTFIFFVYQTRNFFICFNRAILSFIAFAWVLFWDVHFNNLCIWMKIYERYLKEYLFMSFEKKYIYQKSQKSFTRRVFDKHDMWHLKKDTKKYEVNE